MGRAPRSWSLVRVGPLRLELGRPIRGGNELERRIGEREHLLQAIELIEQRKPRIDVPQRFQSREGGEHHVAGDEIAQAMGQIAAKLGITPRRSPFERSGPGEPPRPPDHARAPESAKVAEQPKAADPAKS